jgi:hypothetical protein
MHKAECVLRIACMQDALRCNNNMEIEVSWRDIKKLLPANCTLSQFLGALCHYTYLGEERMQRRLLDISCNGNAFNRIPIPTKKTWDGVQSAHIETLSCSFVIESSSKRANVPIIFRDIMEEVMESRPVTMPLHLRIAAWHDDHMRSWSATRLDIGAIKTVLVPRQALLQKLDPSGELTVPSVRTSLEVLEPLVCQYEKLILHDKVEVGMSLKDALKIYDYFHQLRRAKVMGRHLRQLHLQSMLLQLRV